MVIPLPALGTGRDLVPFSSQSQPKICIERPLKCRKTKTKRRGGVTNAPHTDTVLAADRASQMISYFTAANNVLISSFAKLALQKGFIAKTMLTTG